jgi:hypothetical protein
MHRMTQPGLIWASVPATAYHVSDVPGNTPYDL